MSYKSISALTYGLRFRHRGLGVATVLIVYVCDDLFAAATQNSCIINTPPWVSSPVTALNQGLACAKRLSLCLLMSLGF